MPYKIKHRETGLFYRPSQTGFSRSSSLTKFGKVYATIGFAKAASKGIEYYRHPSDKKSNVDWLPRKVIDFNQEFEIVEA